MKVALKELKSLLCGTKIRLSKKYCVIISKGTCASEGKEILNCRVG